MLTITQRELGERPAKGAKAQGQEAGEGEPDSQVEFDTGIDCVHLLLVESHQPPRGG